MSRDPGGIFYPSQWRVTPDFVLAMLSSMIKNADKLTKSLEKNFGNLLSSSDIQEITKYGTKRKFPRGALILNGLSEPDWVGIVLDGSARGFYTTDDREVTGELYVAGDLIADYYGFIKRKSTGVSIQALSAMTVFGLSRSAYEKLRTENVRTAQIAVYFADYAFLKVYEMAVGFLKMTPQERYNSLCLSRPSVIEEIPQKYIANYLGIQPESLSRLKKKRQILT